MGLDIGLWRKKLRGSVASFTALGEFLVEHRYGGGSEVSLAEHETHDASYVTVERGDGKWSHWIVFGPNSTEDDVEETIGDVEYQDPFIDSSGMYYFYQL